MAMHTSVAVAPPLLLDIPAGTFTMGRADRRPDERPPHRVRVMRISGPPSRP